MPPFSQRPVYRMTSVKEGQHRRPTHANSLEGSPDTEIPSRRDHAFLKGVDRFRCAPGLVVHLCQIQIELRVVYSHSQSLAAERFSVAETLFGHRSQQACI